MILRPCNAPYTVAPYGKTICGGRPVDIRDEILTCYRCQKEVPVKKGMSPSGAWNEANQ